MINTGISYYSILISPKFKISKSTIFNVLEESSVGQHEKVSIRPISKLSASNGFWVQLRRKRVPDDGSCDVEASPDELSPGPRNQQVVTYLKPDAPDLRMLAHDSVS